MQKLCRSRNISILRSDIPQFREKAYIVLYSCGRTHHVFGNLNPEPRRKKIFFLGDSYTHALQVSDAKTYYGVLARRLPVEVFAYGVDGYGTLQEYFILDQYIDPIQPDAIVLQYCANDFINNLYDLEVRSVTNNNGMHLVLTMIPHIMKSSNGSRPLTELNLLMASLRQFALRIRIVLPQEPRINFIGMN